MGLVMMNRYGQLLHGSADKESTCNPGGTGNTGLIPELGRFPGEEIATPTVFLSGEFLGRGGCPKGHKELDLTE